MARVSDYLCSEDFCEMDFKQLQLFKNLKCYLLRCGKSSDWLRLLLKEIILRYELVIVKVFSNYTDHDTDLFPGVLPDLWILLLLPNMCLDLHIIHFCCITMITVVFFF